MSVSEEGARFKRQRAELAINLAMQSRWEEAVAANRSILAVFPTDVDACNRLGKAYTELGRYDEALEAYHKALEIEPSNSIAKKNVSRLSSIKVAPRLGEATAARVDPTLFIGETGKTTVVTLENLGDKEALAGVTAGDQVLLQVKGQQLQVTSLAGDYLSHLEPRFGMRLVHLIQGGNRYEAAVTSVTEHQMKVILREVYQAPEMAGKVSFPSRADTGFRPYIKDSILQYGLEDEEEYAEDQDTTTWEEDEGSPEESGMIAESLPVEADDDDEEEEL